MALEAMTMFYVVCDTCGIECSHKKQRVTRPSARGLKEHILTLGWVITQKKQRILCPECHRKEVADHAESSDLPGS